MNNTLVFVDDGFLSKLSKYFGKGKKSLNYTKKDFERKFSQRLEHIFTGYIKIMRNNYLNVSIYYSGVENALVAQRLEQLSNKQYLHRSLGSSPSQGASTFFNNFVRCKNEK